MAREGLEGLKPGASETYNKRTIHKTIYKGENSSGLAASRVAVGDGIHRHGDGRGRSSRLGRGRCLPSRIRSSSLFPPTWSEETRCPGQARSG